MENIPPLRRLEPVEDCPTACSTASTGSSIQDLPLLQQPTRSDYSATQNSIGSSSDFNVRQISRQGNQLSRVDDAAEPAEPSGHGTFNIADPPTELTPREDWVTADDVFSGPVPPYSNENPLPKVTDDNPVPEITNNIEAADSSQPLTTSGEPATEVANEGSNEPSLSTTSSTVSNSTAPSYGGASDVQNIKAPDEEINRLRQIEDPRGPDWEVLDLPKTTRARMYLYYICHVRKLRVLCDKGKDMTDLPVETEDDYDLLRALTRTNWASRWWTIMIDDLTCPECVALLRARRSDPKSIWQKVWLKIKSENAACLCGDNSHDFVCHHTRTDMNKVTRFFHTLGEKNAARMVNIEFDTNPLFPVDIDVLASAVYNARRYFKDAQRFSIKFHFGAAPIERKYIKGVVCSLAKLEAALPWAHKLHVAGFEDHDEIRKAWVKKSRAIKWWMR